MSHAVASSDLTAGDLLFFRPDTYPRHVGIYLGNGRFVHAPRTGEEVKVERLRIRYWISRFDGARRLTPPDLQPVASRSR